MGVPSRMSDWVKKYQFGPRYWAILNRPLYLSIFQEAKLLFYFIFLRKKLLFYYYFVFESILVFISLIHKISLDRLLNLFY